MSWNVIEGKQSAKRKVVGVLKYREVRRLNISIWEQVGRMYDRGEKR